MLVCVKIKEKDFTARTMKDAYLKACKWVSTNVLAVNNSNNITYKIIKTKDNKLFEQTVRLTLYATLDEDEVFEQHCDICREMQSNLYLRQNKYSCEVCKIPPYRKRISSRLELLAEGVKKKYGY